MSTTTPDVLYLHPAKQQVGFPFTDPRFTYLTPFTLFPVGVIGLANLLKREGFSVMGLNYPAECFIQPGFDLAAWLQRMAPPRVILIDLHWYEHAFGAVDLARVCKYLYPGASVVVGGLTASLYATEILRYASWIDYVIRGDAEQPLLRLVRTLCSSGSPRRDLEAIPNLSYRMDDQIIENDILYCASGVDMEALDFVDIGFLQHAQHYLGLQYVGRRTAFVPSDAPTLFGHWLSIGRGCCYNCSFCGGGRESHSILEGRQGLTMRSVASVVDDIEELSDRGIQQVSLSLDPAIAGESYWRALFAELSQRHVRMGIYNEVFQLPSEAFVEAFAESVDLNHSQLGLSVLSGDERIRQLHGKHFTNSELLASLRVLRQYKVPVAIYYSFNLPGEDESTLRKTIFLSERIGHLIPPHRLMMYNQPHTLDPCSPMSRYPDQYAIEKEVHSFADYVRYCRNTAVELPGVLGSSGRGFEWSGRTKESERRMQQLWLDFGRRQKYLCF